MGFEVALDEPGCLLEGFSFVGIEQSSECCEVAAVRLRHWCAVARGEEER